MIIKNSTRRILIVEDDPSTNKMMRKTLEKSGYEVIVATDGREALKALGAEDLDAILLDLMMPERDGFELCRLIRINPAHENTAIIMMSGLTGLTNVQRALACGANDYITKPWISEEVVIRIASAIRTADIEADLAEALRSVEDLKESYKGQENQISKLCAEILYLRQGLETTAESLNRTDEKLRRRTEENLRKRTNPLSR